MDDSGEIANDRGDGLVFSANLMDDSGEIAIAGKLSPETSGQNA